MSGAWSVHHDGDNKYPYPTMPLRTARVMPANGRLGSSGQLGYIPQGTQVDQRKNGRAYTVQGAQLMEHPSSGDLRNVCDICAALTTLVSAGQ